MGGCQQGRACYSYKEKCMTLYQKKCHICTVEQEMFGNTEEYEGGENAREDGDLFERPS